MPCARPTATTSRMISSRKARVRGFFRIGPMLVRIEAVVADNPTRKTYFSQIARRTSLESSEVTPDLSSAS